MAGKIVNLATEQQSAYLRDRGRLVKAEAKSVASAAWLVGLFPYALVVAVIWLAYLGQAVAASITAIAAVASVGPKLVAAIKGDSADSRSDSL